MFADRKLKKGIGIYIFAVLALIAIFSYLIWDNWKDKQQEFLNEHTSTTAVVVDKYTTSHRGGMFFHVDAEHKALNKSGEEITVIHRYHIPYADYEEYVQIDVGDVINTYYVKVLGWQYLSVEKTDEAKDRVCPHCSAVFNTTYCGDCGTLMNRDD